MNRWIERRALALVMAGTLVAVPALAADAPAGADSVNWTKIADYAMCSVGIAAAATGGGLLLAGLACGRIMIEYWD